MPVTNPNSPLFPYVPLQQPLANSPVPFPVPQPTLGQDLSGQNASPVPEQAPVAPPVEQEPGFFDQLRSTPEGKVALMQMIGGLLQPTGFGKSGAGIAGQALDTAATGFIKNKNVRQRTEQGQQKVDETERSNRAKLEETKRQDVETNPSEAALINLQAEQAVYYSKLPQARVAGSAAARLKAEADATLQASFESEFGLTKPQAVLAVEIGRATDYANIGAIAVQAAKQAMAGNMSFDPEDIAVNTADTPVISGVGVNPRPGTPTEDPSRSARALKAVFEVPDEVIMLITPGSAKEQAIIRDIGQAAWNQRLAQMKGR